MKTLFLLAALCPFTLHARLGENEAQAKARYGQSVPELIGQNDKPLIVGAKELAYNFEGWRVRAAYLNGVTHRIEYIKLPENGQPKPITEEEVQAVLGAEAGKFKWREEKPRTGYDSLNKLQTAVEGRKWERTDHALANLKLNLILTIESRDVDKLEKKAAKTPAKATPPAGAPKF
jgi:hypothetical protein